LLVLARVRPGEVLALGCPPRRPNGASRQSSSAGLAAAVASWVTTLTGSDDGRGGKEQ
jgi:hypothetical protein